MRALCKDQGEERVQTQNNKRGEENIEAIQRKGNPRHNQGDGHWHKLKDPVSDEYKSQEKFNKIFVTSVGY